MKIEKQASGKLKVSISFDEWAQIGRQAQFFGHKFRRRETEWSFYGDEVFGDQFGQPGKVYTVLLKYTQAEKFYDDTGWEPNGKPQDTEFKIEEYNAADASGTLLRNEDQIRGEDQGLYRGLYDYARERAQQV